MHNNIAVGAGLISLDVLIWDESLTLKQANEVIEKIDFVPKVFFFDRVSPAILKLASVFKEKGSVIFFEPSSRGGDVKLFNKCVEVSDILQESSGTEN